MASTTTRITRKISALHLLDSQYVVALNARLRLATVIRHDFGWIRSAKEKSSGVLRNSDAAELPLRLPRGIDQSGSGNRRADVEATWLFGTIGSIRRTNRPRSGAG